MKHFDCQTFLNIWDNFRDGNLPEADHLAALDHLDECERCRDLFEIHQRVENAVRRAELSPLLKRRIAVAAAHLRRSQPRNTRSPLRIGVPITAAVAAGIAMVVFFAGSDDRSLPDVARPTQPSQGTQADLSRTETTWITETSSPVSLSDQRRMLPVFEGTSLWFSEESRVETRQLDSTTAHFHLKSGHVVAEVGPHLPGFRFIISTDDTEVEARGTVFSVTIDGGEPRTRVLEGEVEVRQAQQSRLVRATEELFSHHHKMRIQPARAEDIASDRCVMSGCATPPPEAVPARSDNAKLARIRHRAEAAIGESRLDDASRLISEIQADAHHRGETIGLLTELARAYRRAQMYEQAERVYLRLIQTFPGSETAADSLVAVGQLEYRTLGKAQKALGHFKQYLKRHPTGLLAETARAESVRVLQSTGDHNGAAKAASTYFNHHPEGLSVAEMMRRKADALRHLHRCIEARSEYERIIAKWPKSQEASRARSGLKKCSHPK